MIIIPSNELRFCAGRILVQDGKKKRKFFPLLQVETSTRYLLPPLYKFASFEVYCEAPESREIKTRF